ncbi:MauE/DoxX family redox-associated membrane protein [Microbacterium sp. NPDC057650]|uniref:MauE/DoxX family redox-associated membrane protein n=1 Tax=unclassified Microbacterium TaxID=2609290 RepID=UPI00366CCB0C
MPAALIALPALLLAAVLIASGIAKLRHPDDLSGWADLGVPAALRRTWLLALHPWGELMLGAALVLLGGVPGALAALVALVLMVGYLVFVVRVLRTGTDASCACFGARKRIVPMTAVRNGWYVLLALAAASTTWMSPLLGGTVVELGGAGWTWGVGLAAAAVTVALTMWPVPAQATDAVDPAPTPSVGDDELLDYVRSLTPAVPLTLADGEQVNLRALSIRQPLLLLAVKPGCGSCADVIAQVPAWRELLPEVSVRMLLREAPEVSGIAEREEPQSLHDMERYAYDSLGIRITPSAVLLGADGMLAGGPVTGTAAITEFIADVYESLHGERPVSET